MATKTFKEICVEYAHQLGKGLPLTPAEMCNAVIMYLNTQITEMQSITTALQTAVTEAEASATEATNTANDVSETVNALPKVPKPTTSDNGKVIGVQSGAYALVEQSGGEAPANMLTTDTRQVITGRKGTIEIFYTNERIMLYNVSDEDVSALVNGTAPAGDYTSKTTIYAGGATFASIDGSTSRSVSISGLEGGLGATGFTDYGNSSVSFNRSYIEVFKYTTSEKKYTSRYTYGFPFKSGMLAVEGDIPDLDNYTGTVHIVQGTAGSGIAVHDTANTSPYTKYGYDKIETYGNSNALQYTLNVPNKNGTIATLDDIPTPVTKYFTRIICNDTNTNTLYIFSCITEEDLSGNNAYGDVVSLLTELGAINPTSALPCSGKTTAGGAVICVYTDGSAITVFSGDNATEEIPSSAEINIISK